MGSSGSKCDQTAGSFIHHNQLKIELQISNLELTKSNFSEQMGLLGLGSQQRRKRRSRSASARIGMCFGGPSVYVQVRHRGQVAQSREMELGGAGDIELTRDSSLFLRFDGSEEGSVAAAASTLSTSAPSRLTSRASSSRAARDDGVHVAIYNKRFAFRTKLVGEASFALSRTAQLGKVEEVETDLHRGSVPSGKVCARYTLLRLAEAQATIEASAKHSLLSIIRALVQLLQAPGGIKLFLKARPAAVHVVSEEDAHAELRFLSERLSSESSKVGNDDEIWLKRLSDISREMLSFVAVRTDPGVDIPAVIIEWMMSVSAFVGPSFKSGMSATSVAIMSEERLRRFLEAAQLNMQDLVPIDTSGGVAEFWQRGAAAAKEAGTWMVMLDQIPEEAILGSGSFGYVWRARDPQTGRQFAVKNVQIPRRGSVQLGIRENEIANRLLMEPHQCIVQLFHLEHYADMRLYCFVMELCAGGNLKNWIWDLRRQRNAYALPPQAYHWVGQILLALEHLHGHMDILVRDLKAENVVMTLDGHAKLTDFGLCRPGTQATSDWTFGSPPGSPCYIAPEVVQGEHYDDAADLYSFGVMIWVILTGGLLATVDKDGVVQETQEPLPPCAKMASLWDYACLAENWQLLAKCIRNPRANHARPLPSSEAADLVLALTQPNPRTRPGLADVRQFRPLRQLDLPQEGATSREVIDWLTTVPRARSAPSEACLSCGGSGCSLCRVADDTIDEEDGSGGVWSRQLDKQDDVILQKEARDQEKLDERAEPGCSDDCCASGSPQSAVASEDVPQHPPRTRSLEELKLPDVALVELSPARSASQGTRWSDQYGTPVAPDYPAGPAEDSLPHPTSLVDCGDFTEEEELPIFLVEALRKENISPKTNCDEPQSAEGGSKTVA